MPRKPTLALVGYYGYGNYGDELFDIVLKESLSDFDLVHPQDTLKRPYFTTPLAQKMQTIDASVIGGGDLVIPSYWTDQYFEDAFLLKPVYIFGVGVPTWGGEKAAIVERMRNFFRHDNVRLIHVRDEESKAWVERKLEPRVAVVTSTDMICAMDLPPVDVPAGKPIFGLVSRKQNPGEIRWQNIKALCDKAVSLGYALRHIVLANGVIGIEDREAVAEFDYPGMEVVVSDDNLALTRAIGECTVLASMKFHGCVVATMYGIPAITLITTDKFVNFYKIIEREDLIAHHRHEDLPDRLQRFMPVIPGIVRLALRTSARGALDMLRARLHHDLISNEG